MFSSSISFHALLCQNTPLTQTHPVLDLISLPNITKDQYFHTFYKFFARCSKCLWRCTTHSSFEFLRYHGFSDVQFLITLFAGQDHTYPSDCVSACINWLCKSAEFWGIASKFLQLDRPKQHITFQLDKPARLSFSCYLDLLLNEYWMSICQFNQYHNKYWDGSAVYFQLEIQGTRNQRRKNVDWFYSML